MEAYTKILFALGMIYKLAEFTDPQFGELGLVLESENLPQRI